MKIVIPIILIACGSLFTFFLLGTDKGWMILNSSDAESYAIALLNNHTIETPEKFIDYSVSVSNGYVTFSKHNEHSTIYGYFPSKQIPVETTEIPKLNWKQLSECWFVSHLYNK